MADLRREAFAFAYAAHAAIGQKRKYDGDPYICHPVAVASIVSTVPHDEAMIAAALLHDVVEDTQVQICLIEEFFGPDVAVLVGSLTDQSKPADGNRAVRKAIDRAHSAEASPRAQTIKVADLIHNGRSIAAADPSFAVTYMAEMRALLEVLTKADPTLLATAWQMVIEYEERQLSDWFEARP